MNRWPLFFSLAALLSAAFAAAIAALGTDEAALRTLVRATAQVSFALFLPVYAASPLRRLWPAPATRWLLRNRRYLGVSFAWAHGLHLLAIAMLVLLLGDAFESDPVVLVFGGFTYLLLAGMVLTSTDRTARWLGPRRWNLLHRTGIHALWLLFTISWAGRAASPYYLALTLLAGAVAGLRLAALRTRRAARSGAAAATAR